jgi:hypothetical protein
MFKLQNIKDAGFNYEYFQNKTNQVIWDFCFHETNTRNEYTKQTFQKQAYESNPGNKSFEHSRTKRIHKRNLLKTVWICESKA